MDNDRLVLFVEDDPELLAFNKQQLESAGLTVHTETTAEGARAALAGGLNPATILIGAVFSTKDNDQFYNEFEQKGDIPVHFLLTQTYRAKSEA